MGAINKILGHLTFSGNPNYELIIKCLKTKYKHLICVSILPIATELYSHNYKGNKDLNPRISDINKEIDTANRIIKKLCLQNKSLFLNIHDKCLDSKGNLKKELTWDGIHLNEKGYEFLASEYHPAIKKITSWSYRP